MLTRISSQHRGAVHIVQGFQMEAFHLCICGIHHNPDLERPRNMVPSSLSSYRKRINNIIGNADTRKYFPVATNFQKFI